MAVERKESATGKRFVLLSNGAIPDFKVQRMKSWVMSKQVKLGERRSNVDTPGKAAPAGYLPQKPSCL